MLIWLSRYVPYILIILAGLMLLGRLYASRNRVAAISLTEAVRRLFGRRLIACLALTCVFFAVCAAVKYCYNSMYPSLYISLNYENAAKGKNPNGTRFNASEILSDEVLNEAISRSGYKLGAAELKRCLSLETNYDNVDISASSSTDDLNSLSIATDYRLVFKPNLRTVGVNGKTLLSLIGDVYYEKFMKEKTENVSILDLDFSDYDSSDYHSISDYLKVKADNLKHFIDIYSYADSNYRGANGDSFAAISGKIENFSTVELERMHSYVVENGLTRNPSDYINTTNYKNKLLKLDYDKDMAAYNVRLEAIDMYDHQMATIVLVPTKDEKLEYYMSRTKIGVDDYADQAQTYLEDAKKLKNEIDDNNYASGKVSEKSSLAAATTDAAASADTTVTATAQTAAAATTAVAATDTASAEAASGATAAASQVTAAASNSAAYAEADNLAATLKEELISLSDQCKTIVREYNADRKNALIQTGLLSMSLSSMINVKRCVGLSAVFCILLCAYSICGLMNTRSYRNPDKKQRSKR